MVRGWVLVVGMARGGPHGQPQCGLHCKGMAEFGMAKSSYALLQNIVVLETPTPSAAICYVFLYIYIYVVCMGMIPPSPPALPACPGPPLAGQPEARPTCMSYIHPTHVPSTSCIGRPGPSTALAHVFLQHNCPSETRCHVIFHPCPLLTLSHIEATPGRWGTPTFPISSRIKTFQPSSCAILFNEEFISRTDQILCVHIVMFLGCLLKKKKKFSLNSPIFYPK